MEALEVEGECFLLVLIFFNFLRLSSEEEDERFLLILFTGIIVV
jgi:hypothetical protein